MQTLQKIMKSLINTICICFIIAIIGCTGRKIQPDETKLADQNKESQTVRETDKDIKLENITEKLTHEKLYSEGETRREYFEKIIADPSTTKNVYQEKVGDNLISLTLYYQQNRISSIVFRILNSKNEKIFNRIFYMDEKNNCLSVSTWDKNNPMEYTSAVFGDSLIRFDGHYNIIDLDSSQKQEIVKSTRASLDSIMLHFPEFKYTFDWERK
jgi:hypothetical protein